MARIGIALRKTVEGALLLRLSSPIGKYEDIEIMEHALVRMKQRGISEDDVVETIGFPDEEGLPTGPGRKRVRRKKTPRVAIDVVYQELSDRIVVITAMDVTRRISGRR